VEGSPTLAVESRTILFVSGRKDAAEIKIKNTGTGRLDWVIGDISYSGRVKDVDWLSFSAIDGSIGAGEAATITATVDRTGLPKFGFYGAVIPILSNGGDKSIKLFMWNPLFSKK